MTAATVSDDTPSITVEVWSDIVCPWCYIGKRRFERAVAELAGELRIEVRYRPFQLDPTASPGTGRPVVEAYARKFGGPEQARMIIDRVTEAAAGDGLGFRMDLALRANTLLAHRLLWWAEQPDSPLARTPSAQVDLKERLLRAYFVEGCDVGDPDTLASLVAETGVDPRVVLAFLDGDEGLDEVRADLRLASEIGVSAVPTFVVDGRFAIPGAQDTETFIGALRRLGTRIAAERSCGDDSCAV